MNRKKLFFEFTCLNGCLLIIYFLVLANLKISINEDIAFSAPDSGTYKEVGEWLLGQKQTGYTLIRPFLYPLIILISYKPFGVTGLWFIQFLFWLCSMNFVYYAIKKITPFISLRIIGTLIFAVNLSYIALTLHALSEVTATFLISLLVYYLVKNMKSFRNIKFIHTILLIFVLLTLIKPIFYIWVFIIAGIILVFHLKAYISKPIRVLVVLAIISPLAGQIYIMNKYHNTLKISNIGPHTMRYYLLAQGRMIIDSCSYSEAVYKVSEMSDPDMYKYTL